MYLLRNEVLRCFCTRGGNIISKAMNLLNWYYQNCRCRLIYGVNSRSNQPQTCLHGSCLQSLAKKNRLCLEVITIDSFKAFQILSLNFLQRGLNCLYKLCSNLPQLVFKSKQCRGIIFQGITFTIGCFFHPIGLRADPLLRVLKKFFGYRALSIDHL